MKITSIEGITEYHMENGLKVLLFPDPSKPTVTVNLTVFVGSRHEGYGEAGMAHLLEHMLFKGTPTHPSVPKALQARGAEFNGTTWLDRTNYYETLPATDDNLEFAIRLEADRMINSHIRGEDLVSEMTVVRNEFERGENNPAYVLSQRMMAAAFEWHNYGKSTIGNRADIERVPVENLRQFYQKYYQPDNAMLVVAGRFDEAKALQFIGQSFGELPRPERVLQNTYTEEPAQDGERMVTLRRVGEVALVGTVYHIPPGAHEDFIALDVLETVLTSQPAGRLYKALVERKKAADLSGAAYALHDPGMFRLLAEVAPGNTPESVLDAMLDALQVVVDEGVTEEEVQRARQRLLKQRELNAADSSEIAVELSEWAAQGDWRLYFLYRDRLETIQVADVNRVAKAYLQPSNRTVGLYLPTDQPQRTPVPQQPDLAQLLGDYKGRETSTMGEAFDVAPAAIEARTTRTTVEGIKVALLPKQTRGNTVVLRLTLRYGSLASLRGMNKAAEFLPTIMARGTKLLSRQQIQDTLDQNLATLSASGGIGDATFVVQTKRDQLPAVLALLKQILRDPSLPAAELDLLKQQQKAELDQSLTDPQSLAVRTVSRALSPYPQGDPRYVTTIAEELQELADLTMVPVKDLYTNYLSAQAGQLAVVGDFDPDTTMAAVSDMLAGWTSPKPYERLSRTGKVDVKPELIKLNTPDKANAFFFAGEVFPLRDDHPDFAALTIGNYIFGAGALSSRLGDRIRQKEGLSYGVGSAMRSSALDERTSLSIYAICNPDNAEKVLTGIREELALLLKDGITAAELEQAREGYLQRQEVSRTEDAMLSRLLEESLLANRTMTYYSDLEQQIRQLTPEVVQASFAKHIDPGKLTIVIAGDFKQAAAETAAPAAPAISKDQ